MGNNQEGRHSAKKPAKVKKSRNKKRLAIKIACIVLAVLILGGWFVYEKTLGAIDRIDEDKIEYVDPEDQDQYDEPDADVSDGDGSGSGGNTSTEVVIQWPTIEKINSDGVIKILLLGADVRDDGSRGRSDVIMLATLDEKSGELSLTSIQRDTYVQIPGYKDNRINAAYAFGGTKLLKQVLELNFGLTVDGVIVIDFTRFEQLIDTLGGVEITLTEKEVQYLNDRGGHLKVGKNRLSGKWALAYSRIRKIDSDFGRTNRQRTVMDALFQAYRGISLSEIPGMLNTILPMISTDMSDSQLISYATKVLSAGATDINSFSIPFSGAYKNQVIRKMQVLVPDLQKCRDALQQHIYGKSYK